MAEGKEGKAAHRLLQFMADHRVVARQRFVGHGDASIMLTASSGKKLVATRARIDALVRAGLLEECGKRVRMTDIGRAKLARDKSAPDGFASQHRHVINRKIIESDGVHEVAVNINESPLQRLRNTSRPGGGTWLDSEHVEAGERLRRDFTRGQLMQKVTSSWSHSIGRTRGGQGGKADLSDTAIDARARVERAIECVGPDLGNIVMDACCFLKGLELIERERRWPPRSAKLMLRTGLALLARHYGTRAGYRPMTRN